jgi:hypothetical protein
MQWKSEAAFLVSGQSLGRSVIVRLRTELTRSYAQFDLQAKFFRNSRG